MMMRNRRKKALYEVIGPNRSKSSYKKTLEPLHSTGTAENQAGEVDRSDELNWPKRPKMIQYNNGRIEISMPYQLAVAVVLGMVLIVLVAFKTGFSLAKPPTADTGALEKEKTEYIEAVKTEELSQEPIVVTAAGDHRIVITQYHANIDLVPVQRYFEKSGIDTIIEKRGNTFFLVTKNLFGNPQKSGTDGFEMKKRIMDIGAEYKAPKNYESFAPGLFKDVYGEKVKN